MIGMPHYKPPTIAEIASFLRAQRQFCCNQCIEKAFAARRNGRIGEATRTLALARKYYETSDNVSCSICGDIKKCIRFVE